MIDDEQDRPLDVTAIMAELQAVVDADRRGVAEEPVFVAGGADDEAEGVHFDMALLHSTRPVVGGAITATKRAVARSIHTLLEDFANQVTAALGDLRETADTAASQLERVYLALDELRSRVEHLARLEARLGEIDAIAARIDAIDQLALEARLARLEQRVADDRPVAPAPPTAPIPVRVGGMAIARARIDHVTDDRLPAYWAVLDASAPILNLTPGGADVVDSLQTAGFTVRSVDADPVDAALSGADLVTDPVRALEACDEGSLGGIVAIGIGDYLPPEAWMRLAPLAARALRPGGGLVVEVINAATPAGMALRSRNPSFAQPIHAETLAFLFRAAGFDDAEVRTLGAFPDDMRAPIEPDTDWFGRRINAMAGVVNTLVVGEPLAAVLARR